MGLRFKREPLFSTHFLEKTPLSHKGGSPLNLGFRVLMGLEVEDSCHSPPPLSLHPHHDLRVSSGTGAPPQYQISSSFRSKLIWLRQTVLVFWQIGLDLHVMQKQGEHVPRGTQRLGNFCRKAGTHRKALFPARRACVACSGFARRLGMRCSHPPHTRTCLLADRPRPACDAEAWGTRA